MARAPAELKEFVAELERITQDPAKVAKVVAMLRADRFELFVDATDDQVVGVVKSQGDASLVYSCRLTKDGDFSCCTQNLNACGGLRGNVCKHILVLMVGLVQGGALPREHAIAWVRRSRTKKPVLDKDAAGVVFIRYKGAEAGEVDWRPTETLPEDYYAL
jgi:hypothetical protein